MTTKDKKIALIIVVVGILGILVMPRQYVKDKTVQVKQEEKSKMPSTEHVIGYIDKSACWVDDYSDITKLADALRRSDEDYLKELIMTGKVHIMKKRALIEISDSLNESVAMIYFKEGQYTGKWGYTLKAFVKTKEAQIEKETVKKAMLAAIIKGTDDYSIPIQEGILDKAKNNKEEYKKYEDVIIKEYADEGLVEFKNEVLSILYHRILTLDYYIKHVESYQKNKKTSADTYKKLMYDSWSKEKELRQKFLNDYGF